MQRFYIHVILFQWKMTVCQGLAIDGYKLIIFWCYYLITFGTTWNYWEPLGSIWNHSRALGNLEPFVTVGTIWNLSVHLEPFGPFWTIETIRNYCEPFAIIRKYFEPTYFEQLRSILNHLKPFGTIGNHLIFELAWQIREENDKKVLIIND